jgi:hypothetical protein
MYKFHRSNASRPQGLQSPWWLAIRKHQNLIYGAVFRGNDKMARPLLDGPLLTQSISAQT